MWSWNWIIKESPPSSFLVGGASGNFLISCPSKQGSCLHWSESLLFEHCFEHRDSQLCQFSLCLLAWVCFGCKQICLVYQYACFCHHNRIRCRVLQSWSETARFLCELKCLEYQTEIDEVHGMQICKDAARLQSQQYYSVRRFRKWPRHAFRDKSSDCCSKCWAWLEKVAPTRKVSNSW